jgi:hypothetical protein
MQKGNQKAVARECKKIIRKLSVHRLLITVLHCLSTVFLLPFCIVYPPPSYYLFAFSNHRLLITFFIVAVARECKKVIRRRWTDNAKR